MKKLFTYLLLIAPVFLLSFAVQGGIDSVISALRNGNAGEISRYMDEHVEISLPDKSSNYSRSQGSVILRDFFANNGVKSFDLKHKGDGPTGQYCVGTLHTKNGSYRTNVFMKTRGNEQLIKEIRFQPID